MAISSTEHLNLFQFLLTNDAGRKYLNAQSHTKGKTAVVGECGGGNMVQWESDGLIKSVLRGHSAVARWFHGNGLVQYKNDEVTDRERAMSAFGYPQDKRVSNRSVMEWALEYGDIALAEYFLLPGRCVLDYGRRCSRPEIIEWKLDCGYFERDLRDALTAVHYTVKAG
ncbi:DNA excision repair protein ERCC-6 [Phytophthora pseudosyringae]|uniref:DNA excision repair protein ERCC-6 n=1 Tax=Phytophthora pseudosyringae TaxID=221518 RepID=A0A8T1V8M4_9STRA|nr:DNA excision repair protein ERCC-6 [Phytophthora pseudosyringae]